VGRVGTDRDYGGVAPLGQGGHRGLHDVEQAEQVGCQDRLPLVERGVGDEAGTVDARRDHHAVESAERRGRARHRRVDLGRVADVGRRRDETGDRLEPSRPPGDAGDTCAAAERVACDRLADPRRGAGHEDSPFGQIGTVHVRRVRDPRARPWLRRGVPACLFGAEEGVEGEGEGPVAGAAAAGDRGGAVDGVPGPVVVVAQGG
jgi:hypothetical protein